MILLREIQERDAEQFLSLRRQLDDETSFMMLEPGERTTTLDEVRQQIQRVRASSNQTILVAEVDKRLVGYLAASGGMYQRNRTTAYITMGILQAFSGRGIGTQLFAELEDWAGENGLHRLELTVMAHNQAAIHLYQKAGFEIEGLKKHSLKVNGEYVDELYMGKIIASQP